MQEYEITYLSHISLSEDARAQLDAAIDASIEKAEGAISHNSTSIRRRLVYPIQKQSGAFLRVVQTSIEPEHIEALKESLRKMEGVVRLTVIKTPRREEVSTAIFETAAKPAAAPAAAPATPAREVTMAEVEEKIAEALDEEVK
jgi:ribosomal protein S6